MSKGLIDKLPAPPPGKTGWPWTVETNPAVYKDVKSWPTISIVTPSYNQGAFVEETIRSILLQNYPALEYFVFDGGSNDQSVEIIKKYEPWLTYWVSEKDKGQSDAINKGIKRSGGDIFNWINSDDSLLKNALFNIARYYQDDDQLGIIKGRCQTYNVTYDILQDLDHIADGREYRALFGAGNNHQPSSFMKMEGVKFVNGVDEERHFGMDMDLMIALSLRYETIEIPELIAKATLHDSSKTASQGEKFAKDWSKNFSKLLRTFPKESEKVVERMRQVGYYENGTDKYDTQKTVQPELVEGAFRYFLLSLAVFLYAGGASSKARGVYNYLLATYPAFYLQRKIFMKHLLAGSIAQKMIRLKRKYR